MTWEYLTNYQAVSPDCHEMEILQTFRVGRECVSVFRQSNVCKDSSDWDMAIQDAERKLKHTEARTRRLRTAIETFKAHKLAGIPWPGAEKKPASLTRCDTQPEIR